MPTMLHPCTGREATESGYLHRVQSRVVDARSHQFRNTCHVDPRTCHAGATKPSGEIFVTRSASQPNRAIFEPPSQLAASVCAYAAESQES